VGRYAVFIGLRPPVSPVAKTIPEPSRAFQCLPRHPSGVEPLVTTARLSKGLYVALGAGP